MMKSLQFMAFMDEAAALRFEAWQRQDKGSDKSGCERGGLVSRRGRCSAGATVACRTGHTEFPAPQWAGPGWRPETRGVLHQTRFCPSRSEPSVARRPSHWLLRTRERRATSARLSDRSLAGSLCQWLLVVRMFPFGE